MTEKTIYFDNPREAAELVGKRGDYLARIEGVLSVRLSARDTWLKIEGDDIMVKL